MGGYNSKAKDEEPPPPNKSPFPLRSVPTSNAGVNLMASPTSSAGYSFSSTHLSRPRVFAFGSSAGGDRGSQQPPKFHAGSGPCSLTRPSIHSGQSVYDKMYRSNSGSRKGIARRKKLTAHECVRLEEKGRYAELLSKFISPSTSRLSSGPVPTPATPPQQPGRIFGGATKVRLIDNADVTSSFNGSKLMTASTPMVSSGHRLTSLPNPGISMIHSSLTPMEAGAKTKSIFTPFISQPVGSKENPCRIEEDDDDVMKVRKQRLNTAHSVSDYRTATSSLYSTATEGQPDSMIGGIGKKSYLTLQRIREKRERNSDKGASPSLSAASKVERKEPVIEDDVEIIGEELPPRLELPPLARSPLFERTNEELTKSPFAYDSWLRDLQGKYSREARCKITEMEVKMLEEQREEKDKERDRNLSRRIRQRLRLSEKEPPAIKDEYIDVSSSSEEEEEEDEFPELSDAQEAEVSAALQGYPPGEVLSSGYRLQITRADMATLKGLNWLNDEIINFYMNMLMERGEKEGMPKVHAFNTFFYPKIMSSGQQSVKRWTKKIDIFSLEFILVPVHLGMHWCLAVVDLKEKAINYYDSMGGNNNACLNALKQYLMDESMDKKKQPFDTSDFKLTNVKKIPQQYNGSDCGMFACKFAEYVTRRAEINFSQEHMPYFRHRMVYEIISKKLM